MGRPISITNFKICKECGFDQPINMFYTRHQGKYLTYSHLCKHHTDKRNYANNIKRPGYKEYQKAYQKTYKRKK